MLRKLVGTAALIIVSAGAAHAQMTGPVPNTAQDNRPYYNPWAIGGRERTPEDAGRDAEIEMKYRETLRTKIPDRRPSSNDPWRTVRQAPAATSSAKHRVE
jgi:hypothetical protein